jgi:hypothetical protein
VVVLYFIKIFVHNLKLFQNERTYSGTQALRHSGTQALRHSRSLKTFLLIYLLFLASCQKDVINHQIIKINNIPILTVDEAKINFEVFNSLENISSAGFFPKIKITPDWTKSKQYIFADLSVIETPLLWNNETLGMFTKTQNSTTESYKNPKDVETITSLITVKDFNGYVSKKLMMIRAYENYLKNNDIHSNNFGHIEPDFTGEVCFYNEDGSLHIGWIIVDGKITKTKKISTSRNLVISSRDYSICYDVKECTYWYVNGVYVGTSDCVYYTECTNVSDNGNYYPYVPGNGSGGIGGLTLIEINSDSDLDVWGPDEAPPGCKAEENRNLTVQAFISKCKMASITKAPGFPEEFLTRKVGDILDRANTAKEKKLRKLINETRFNKPD